MLMDLCVDLYNIARERDYLGALVAVVHSTCIERRWELNLDNKYNKIAGCDVANNAKFHNQMQNYISRLLKKDPKSD